jgi:ATP-dependent RNA helicase DHX8/PRP22
MFGRCLIASAQLNCSMEMLIVVAMVSCDMTVFLTPREKREEALSVHRQFVSVQGDHCTLLNVYSAWNSVAAKKRRRWADDNFINNRALLKAHDIKEQLEKHLVECKLPITSCGDNWETLRKGLVGGLFPHAAKLQADGTYRVLATGQQVSLHPSSVLHGKRHNCIIFNELVRTTKQYVRCVTVIEPGWLVELAPTFFSRKQ